MSYCLGCLKDFQSKSNIYCPTCRKYLFGNVSVLPLDFDKTQFYKHRQELAPRMSISGVQDKISLQLIGKKLTPTDVDGHYILKPVPSSTLMHPEDIVPNEHLSMQISSQIYGIPTALSGVIPFKDGELAYIVKRFDYAKDGTKLDQEDFASVLNRNEASEGEAYKYSGNYALIAEAIKRVIPTSVLELENFYKRVLLNYLIGNGDAHLKNFSIYRPFERDDYILTPNYDLLYTKYHINETIGEMALDLFEDDDSMAYNMLGYYSMMDFEEFSQLLGLPKKRMKKLFQNVFESVDTVKNLTARSFLSEQGKFDYLNNYINRLEKRIGYSFGYSETTPSVIKPAADAYFEKRNRLNPK